MAFRFALAPLLRLRRSIEHQRALALRKASLNVQRAREALAAVDRSLDDSSRADSRSLAAGRMAAELQFAILIRERLQQLRLQLQDEIGRREALREQAAHEYRQALQEREVLEAVCTRQRHAYQLDQMRRQQRELDAAFLLQRWHKRDG